MLNNGSSGYSPDEALPVGTSAPFVDNFDSPRRACDASALRRAGRRNDRCGFRQLATFAEKRDVR